MRKLLIATLLTLTACATAPSGGSLFTLTDPQGDDYGNGKLVYPMNPDFERGELDLLSLTASKVPGGTDFEASFARPVRIPQRRTIDGIGTQLDQVARLGFYNLNLDIYIDTDGVPGSGSITTLPGRGVTIAGTTAWEKAIALTPDPQTARGELRRIVVRDERRREKAEGRKGIVTDETKTELQTGVDEYVYFPTQVRVAGNRITFHVPDTFLGGEPKKDWSYVVAVSGADLIQRHDQSNRVMRLGDPSEALMILPVGTGRPTDRFGGAIENDTFLPPLVDIIVGGGEEQKAVLSNYDADADRPAVLTGVRP
ncbi:MAG TPA: glucodextranase DOMON-like domain-containing protein [Thermoanaerobaculia bacterium]|nr:glucodextranase DOMON-like domain-containing protein [Thermoanaerobaculia bacterium]